jgi:hypothetical protein
VIAGTATAVSNRVSRRQAGRWAAQESQQQPQPAYPEPPPPTSAGLAPDKVTSLKQLAELRDQGVLTDSEFEVEKRKVLSS